MKKLILAACILLGHSVYAEAPPIDEIESMQNARIQMQINYAKATGEQIIDFIKDYRSAYPQATRDDLVRDVDWFKMSILRNGNDPIISGINYIPEQSLSVRLHDSSFIESDLRGKEFLYLYQNGEWYFESTDGPPVGADRGIDDSVIKAMNKISSYCQAPQGVIYPEKPLDDKEWCPLWHQFVWPEMPLNEISAEEICPK